MEREHVGALDGLRGLAVIAVVLYHGGVPWLGGGFLGVELFFVLSGFLITSLLVGEWVRRGRISLARFWARRARRLLPALIVLVVVIGIYYAAAGATKAVPGLLGNGLAALLYYSNWHQIAAGGSYFAASGPVSPFQHTWSLAIEEQFYVVWPLVVLGLVTLAVRRRAGGDDDSRIGALRVVLGATLAGLVVAAADSGLLFAGGASIDRLYYGTDTRATGLLAGAGLAIWLAIRRLRSEARADSAGEIGAAEIGAAETDGWPRRALALAAFPALAFVIVAMYDATGSSAWLFPWGFLAVDLAAVVVIASVVLASGALADRILSLSPLRATGRVSYGIYLWHFPLFLWLDTDSTHLSGWRLLLVRLAVTLLVSWLSYVIVEQPIRRRQRPSWWLGWLAPVGAGGAVASLLAAAAAAALPTGVPVYAKLPAAAADLAGKAPACTVQLTDTPGVGVAGLASSTAAAKFEYAALGDHSLVWHGSTSKTFNTCPPKRVLIIGDSIAFTLGLPMLAGEQNYGLELADGAILGCAFSTRGELDVDGVWQKPDAGCPNALATWAAEKRRLHASEVVIELGYRDEFEWRWGSTVEHLGMPAFDAYVQQQIDRFVQVLGAGGTKILFLDVPFTSPPAQPDGSPAPAASPARHALINAMLRKAAATAPAGQASVLDIDATISPGGHYDAKVDGQLCRFDGIHFSLFCGALLEPKVLTKARSLLSTAVPARTR